MSDSPDKDMCFVVPFMEIVTLNKILEGLPLIFLSPVPMNMEG